jgi:hypothetical protein
MANKKQLRSRYAQQRREAKQAYVFENGSPEGWKSSLDFKRIARNQRRAERRYKERRQKDLNFYETKREKGLNQDFFSDEQIIPWSLYHTVLGYGDGPRALVRQQFQVLDRLKDKDTYLRIEGPKGGVRIYRTLADADRGLQALYQQGNRLQGDDDGGNYGMLVAAISGENEYARFVNIYTMDISGIDGDFELPDLPPST